MNTIQTINELSCENREDRYCYISLEAGMRFSENIGVFCGRESIVNYIETYQSEWRGMDRKIEKKNGRAKMKGNELVVKHCAI